MNNDLWIKRQNSIDYINNNYDLVYSINIIENQFMNLRKSEKEVELEVKIMESGKTCFEFKLYRDLIQSRKNITDIFQISNYSDYKVETNILNLKGSNKKIPSITRVKSKGEQSRHELYIPQKFNDDICVRSIEGTSMDNYSDFNIYKVLNFYLDEGNNINIVDKCGITLLHLIAHPENLGVPLTDYQINVLLGKKLSNDENLTVKISSKDINESTIFKLMYHYINKKSSKNMRNKICKYLIKKGINMNSQDIYGWTPLHWSIALKDDVMTEYLLKKGASPNICEFENGMSPLHFLCRANTLRRLPFLAQILPKVKTDLCDNDGDSLLHILARNMSYGNCMLLIKNGFNIYLKNNIGINPLNILSEQLMKNHHSKACVILEKLELYT
jgi:ankyrin repeat protein